MYALDALNDAIDKYDNVSAEVLEPAELREEIRASIADMYEKYITD